RALLIGAGVGAGAAVLVVGGVVVWRMTRPTSMRERVERVIPPTIWERARHVVESVELGLRRSVPPVRLYVGDRQVGEEAATTRWEKIGLRFAQAAGSAVGAALIARLMGRLKARAGHSRQIGHCRVDRTRADGVDADAERAALHRQRLSQPGQA